MLGMMHLKYGVEWEVSERHSGARAVREPSRIRRHVSGVFTRDFEGENNLKTQHQLVQYHQDYLTGNASGLGLTIPNQISAAYLPSCKAACTVFG